MSFTNMVLLGTGSALDTFCSSPHDISKIKDSNTRKPVATRKCTCIALYNHKQMCTIALMHSTYGGVAKFTLPY